MKIVISGIQSSGKTTLINALSKHPNFSTFTIINEGIRKLSIEGYKINEDTDDTSQLLINEKRIKDSLLSGNYILDRGLLDSYVYSIFLYNHNKISYKTLEHSKLAFEKYLKHYDLIAYTVLDFEPQEDGLRDIKGPFFYESIPIFEKIITKIPPHKLIRCEGSLTNRINTLQLALLKLVAVGLIE